MIGERLGKWAIYRELGQGGMGRVYLAQEELNGRTAALKVLAAELAQEAGFLQRFQREIETLSKLTHPNIVRFYEAGFENGLYFYAMEYVDGPTLEQILTKEKRLPWEEVLDIAQQICPALKHVHDHGIIHRDLKPANILRAAGGLVKLSDFGIVKVFAGAHLTATRGVVGTAEYMSPEQASGKNVTKRSDLYSFGAVLYTLLTGRPPFDGKDSLEVLHKHLYARFDRPQMYVPELPYEVDEIICQLLEKDPEARPPDGMVLGKQLDKLRRKLEHKSSLTDVGGRSEGTVAESRGTIQPEDLPGPATLMSTLMRAELERERQAGPLQRFFNRPSVLLLCLAACIGVLVWAFWPLSPETLYERGVRLMASDKFDDWETAWKEYLEPLNREYPEHPYQAEVEQLRQKLESMREEKRPQLSDAERFVQQGEALARQGQAAEARKVWQHVIVVFDGSDAHSDWVRRARDNLRDLERQQANAKRLQPAREAQQRAAKLQRQGKQQDAEAIWRAIEDLYRHDPAAAVLLQEVAVARQRSQSPEMLYKRGARLMASDKFADWETAWKEYLEPLSRDYPDHPYQAAVEQLRQKLETARLEQRPLTSDAERFVQQGETLARQGQAAEARKLWQHVIVVFDGSDPHSDWVRRARENLRDPERPQANSKPLQSARAALQRAAKLQQQGKQQEAEAIWHAIEALYRHDPAAAVLLQEVAVARERARPK